MGITGILCSFIGTTELNGNRRFNLMKRQLAIHQTLRKPGFREMIDTFDLI